MIIETLSAFTKLTRGALEPVRKLNQQAVAPVEKLAARQLESLKTYSDMGVGFLSQAMPTTKAAAKAAPVAPVKTEAA